MINFDYIFIFGGFEKFWGGLALPYLRHWAWGIAEYDQGRFQAHMSLRRQNRRAAIFREKQFRNPIQFLHPKQKKSFALGDGTNRHTFLKC